jgi:hypothetical protein
VVARPPRSPVQRRPRTTAIYLEVASDRRVETDESLRAVTEMVVLASSGRMLDGGAKRGRGLRRRKTVSEGKR